MPHWRTSIMNDKSVEPVLRDEQVSELIKSGDWPSVQYLTLTGIKPAPNVRILFEAMLIACVDHGVAVASAQAARYAASVGVSLSSATAAGLLAIGPKHGGAATTCALALQDFMKSKKSPAVWLEPYLKTGVKIPGFGHKVLKVPDPRVLALIEVANKQGFGKVCLPKALEVQAALITLKGKPIYLNIDGIIAVLTLEMGLEAVLADAIFICSRTTGLLAHVLEERVADSLRRVPAEDYEYLKKQESSF